MTQGNVGPAHTWLLGLRLFKASMTEGNVASHAILIWIYLCLFHHDTSCGAFTILAYQLWLPIHHYHYSTTCTFGIRCDEFQGEGKVLGARRSQKGLS